MQRPMVCLSVNLNKVATLRNARTPQVPGRSPGRPSVVEAARTCIGAGAPGITVHPRADERHITATDVRELAALLGDHPDVELNLEGDPRPDLLALAHEVRPQQLTLVPVQPGEVTSSAGWATDTPSAQIEQVVADAQAAGMRVSLFCDPTDAAMAWAGQMGADRVELYAEPFARAFERGTGEASYARYAAAAERAHALGMGINAGHDLDLDNLVLFARLPHLAEVSIGHALIADALDVGLTAAVRAYLAAVGPRPSLG
jgi:pyridoxine 5-phosphate synthase